MPTGNREKLRVVVDANVVVSALHFKGKPREVLDLIRAEGLELCFSPFILGEITSVLTRDFGWSDQATQEAIAGLTHQALLVEPHMRLSVIKGKDNDNRILECAVEGKAKLIVSGDKRHLLPLKQYAGIRIISPDEMLKEWVQRDPE